MNFKGDNSSQLGDSSQLGGVYLDFQAALKVGATFFV